MMGLLHYAHAGSAALTLRCVVPPILELGLRVEASNLDSGFF